VPSSFPSAAILGSVRTASRQFARGITLVPSLAARARSRETSSFAFHFACPKTHKAGIGKLGPPDANEAGEGRGSQRDPHFDDHASATRGRCLPSSETPMTVSDTSVASSVRTDTSRGCELALWFEGRQDRFHEGLCEERALRRSEVPSATRYAAQPALHFKIRNADEPAVLCFGPALT